MTVDEAVAIEVLREALTHGGYLLRIALCQRDRDPLVVCAPRSPGTTTSTELWDALMEFLSGSDLVTLVPRGTCVALATIAPGIVVAAEFTKVNQLGVAAVLAKTAADEISRRALHP